MAAGIDSCMFCGNHLGSDIDHFRPKSRFPLRTFDWDNHLLVCAECNRRKGDVFPGLIDPTTEDPFDHLHLQLADGRYLALTPKGESTIDILKLNVRRLPEARALARRTMAGLLSCWRSCRDVADKDGMAAVAATIREQPFAVVAQAMLRQAVHPDAELLLRESPGTLRLLRDKELRATLLTPPPG
ncbi:HNH endonuclease [Streptomyces sp. 8K308]|uniref:HNH endonuclease n=1 Tax=Streptomyces sp. 8K308 TaxID=2530388 RepID=UPI0014055EC3|nr:HNH endonuclease [Streptomyces sp. 8K308]